MNGKKAKALRRIAQQQTVGFQDTDYRQDVKLGAPRLVDAKCERGVALFLKKQVRQGAMVLRKGAR